MGSEDVIRHVVAALLDTNHDAAIRALRQAIGDEPDAVLPRFQAATILASRGLHTEAASVLAPLVDVENCDPGVRFLYARQLHIQNKRSEAIDQYREVLRSDPLCEKACLYLAELLMTRPDAQSEAADFADRALELRPPDCMVPLGVFEAARTRIRGNHDTVIAGESTKPPLGDLSLGEIILLHPRACDVLQEAGISCASCAGYSDQTLASAAEAVGADLDVLSRRLHALAGN